MITLITQLVECFPFKEEVISSNLIGGTIKCAGTFSKNTYINKFIQ